MKLTKQYIAKMQYHNSAAKWREEQAPRMGSLETYSCGLRQEITRAIGWV